ncbi:MAG: glycosyltransferase [Candidatus Hydrogenedentes bacterium]|nr:glycosyltransferase [Candidatus Hydrogenedentota bacterium]
MRVGVNTLGLGIGYGDEEDVYIRRALACMRDAQSNTSFVLFTSPANHDSFEGWERIRVDVPDASKALARAVGAAAVDCLCTSLRAAPPDGTTPLVLYEMDVAAVVRDAGASRWRGAGRIKRLRQLCQNAHAVVAPSRAVQQAFLDGLDVALDRVLVAWAGADAVLAEPQPGFVQEPYILLVGSTDRGGNVAQTVEIIKRWEDAIPHGFVVVGRSGDEEPGDWGDRVLRLEDVPARQLGALYQHCDLFLCPGDYSGTAVHVIEAMRAGARIVAARVGAIPEVAGRVPVYFEPGSARSMMGAIRRALEDTAEERAECAKAAAARAVEFTWERCGWRMLHAFRSL